MSESAGITPELVVGLQRLIDRDAIRDVLARYARGIDRADGELTETVYHEEAFDDHGEFRGLGKDFARTPRNDPNWRVSSHTLGQSIIDIEGDTAHAETYCIYHYDRFDYEKNRQRAGIIVNRYFDRFERRDGQWRIAFRRVLYEYSHDHDTLDRWPGFEKFTQGLRSREDDVYHPERLRQADTRVSQP